MGTAANILVGAATLSVAVPYTGSYVDVGYTSRGAVLNYNPSFRDISVPWQTLPVDSVLVSESIVITVNLLEATLANLRAAISAAENANNTITLGADRDNAVKIAFKMVGLNPAGFNRTVTCAYGIAKSAVTMPFSKEGVSEVPFEFHCLKLDGTDALTITDATS